MNIKKYFQKDPVSKIILILSIILVILVVFQAGFLVGHYKGTFVNNLNDRYYRGMGDPRSFLAPFMQRGDEINPHGAAGEIISKNLPKIIVKGQGRAEEIININSKTDIRKFRNIASTSDLTVGENIVAIGEPNDNGEIDAKIIRIMTFSGSTTPRMMMFTR